MTSPTTQQRPAPQAQQAQANRPSAEQAAEATNGQVDDKKSGKHWIVIEVTEAQSKGLREMSRTTGGKAADFYRSLLAPAIDVALKDFSENREVMTARAKAQAAKTAAERAAEIARKAEEEAAQVEAKSKNKES